MNSLTEPPQQHLDDSFFDRDAQIVAQELLGTVIRHCVDGLWLSARIIETEAYYVDEKPVIHRWATARRDERCLCQPVICTSITRVAAIR